MTDVRNKPPPLTTFGPPPPRKPLTAVQEEVAQRLARGMERQRIAEELGMHESSVAYHTTQIARLLNMPDCGELTDREQVIAWAYWEYRRSA
jgi:DNA-binding NarL/FixJ family response regulator